MPVLADLPVMPPVLAVLSLSDSFSEFWPRLAKTTEAELVVADEVPTLLDRGEPFAIIIAAAGEETEIAGWAEQIRGRSGAPIGVVGAAEDHRSAISVLKAGGDDYFALPMDVGALRAWTIERAERAHDAARAEEHAARRKAAYDFTNLIGESQPFTDALNLASRIIPHSASTVLITGETGTGKELIARAIHYNGDRARAAFVEVNCTALPEQLLESELFGYEAGAFTGAQSAKPGLFEIANGGTLFLDEIGDLPLALQGKILRVLEERTLRRLGGLRIIKVDVRIIAATHVDLAKAVKEKKFREDLFYRLNILPIELPPLRNRGRDLILLANHFLRRFAGEYGQPGLKITPAVERTLLDHSWPGNVRELRNVIERAVLLSDGELHPDALFRNDRRSRTPASDGKLPFPATIREIEVAAAYAAVDHHGGNKTRAAGMLDISRKYLYDLLSEGDPRDE